MMNNNPLDNSRRIDTYEEKPLFGKVPQLGFVDKMMNVLLSHWKLILFLTIVLMAGLYLWRSQSSNEQTEKGTDDLSAMNQKPSVDKTMIEGIYYGEYVDGKNDEPFTASVTRSSYGEEHYLLSAHGQVFDFYFNRAEGTLVSQDLGTGEISVDSITTEIIIKINGWIFKHSD